MKLTHITLGRAGLYADSSAELSTAIASLRQAGFYVMDIEDDPEEPWHVATIQYTGGPHTLRGIRQALGLSVIARHG